MKVGRVVICLTASSLTGITHAFSSTRPASLIVTHEATTTRLAAAAGREIKGEITPTNNMILVKLNKEDEATAGGLFLGGKAKTKKTEGVVVSVGPGRTHQESGYVFDMKLSPGENVVYGAFDGTEVNYKGDEHVLIRDDDVLVKFDGDATLENAQVMSDNVLVKVDMTQEDESTGGILIAKSASTTKKPTVGEVVKVGPGRVATNGVLMEMDVAVGDMVKYRDYSTSQVEIEDEDYFVVKMTDILGKY